MIPEMVDGVLPEEIHNCTIEEIEEKFGRGGRTGQRDRLTGKLREFLQEAKSTGFVVAVVVDGSFVTSKDEPNDIDIIVALHPEFDLTQEVRPFEYNVCSKRMIKRFFKFDAFIHVDGTEEYQNGVRFFSRIREDDPDQKCSREKKGLLRVEL